MAHQMPSRGAMAGVKEDLKRAKESGGKYDPRGTGAAWTHNFLNQKPWHPSNFRNKMKTWETEQKSIADTKEKEKAQAEFDTEQEYLQTLSFLSPEQQQRYRDRQSISFMYQKPPGYDAALAKDKEAEDKRRKKEEDLAAGAAAAALPSTSAPDTKSTAVAAVQQQQQQQQQHMGVDVEDKIRLDPFKTMLAARAALQGSDRFSIKAVEGVHGGYNKRADNQQLLDEEGGAEEDRVQQQQEQADQEAALLASLSEEDRRRVLKRLKKMQEKQARKEQLQEAEAVLLAAGFDLNDLPKAGRPAASSSSGSSSSSSSSSSGESGEGGRDRGAHKKKSKQSDKRKRSKKSKSRKSKTKRHKSHHHK